MFNNNNNNCKCIEGMKQFYCSFLLLTIADIGAVELL